MSFLNQLFNWNYTNLVPSDEIPNLYPLPIFKADFLRIDIETIYAKILTDVCERTHGIPDDLIPLLFDNCVSSSTHKGVITLLSEAMSRKSELFLVYNAAVKIVRLADNEEKQAIIKDYEKQGYSDIGVYISFKNYQRTDMLKLYSALEYCLIGALNKGMNTSNAVQLKINDLRSSVSLADSSIAIKQGQAMATALSAGRDVMLDAKDSITIATPDVAPVQAGIDFIDGKRAFYLGMPQSYIDGAQTTGIGSTGESDSKAVERGLKNYYFSIIKPVLEALWDISTTFRTQDFRMIATAMEALKTFSLIDDSLISIEDKKSIINQLLDINDSKE